MYIQSKKARLLGLKLGLFDTRYASSTGYVHPSLLAELPPYARVYKRKGTVLVTDRLLPPCVTPSTDGGWRMVAIPHGYCLPENIQDKDPRYGNWFGAGKDLQRVVTWHLHPRVLMMGLQSRRDMGILVTYVVIDGRCLEHEIFGTHVFIGDDF